MNKKFAIDRGRWLAASPYLNEALDLPPDRLDAWLQELAATQPAIAVDLRQLLAAQTDAFNSFLSGQALLPGEIPYSYQGEVIGNYRVLRELGSGGMAVVYLAERADGHFEQRVALKILRFGADSAETRRHFAQERQILASLNHPAIARLIDGGITSAGLPYLAMEYVEGMPIDRYCDQRRASIAERLQLFLKVADAVQYAHHQLIVHRDLKPSNIVVAPDGSVKLLDFGIAKLLDPDGFVHAAPPTRDAVRLLTPEYASPEQARGDPITTATDVHQLGRLLYELLTGRSPYPPRARNSLAALRAILETEPRRPSAAISSAETAADTRATLEQASAARGLSPERLRQSLRGDLDAILLTALEKEPQRRYASVARLADDVERYLQRRPVSARHDARFYRTRKFLRRHVAGVVTAAVVLSSFVLLSAWHTVQLSGERDRAAAEAQRARREAATAAQISDFMSSVFHGSQSRMARPDTTARELLDRGAERVTVELRTQPAVQARLLNLIGNIYLQYDLLDKAQPLIERALRLNREQFGAGSIEVAESNYVLAAIFRDRGDMQRARQVLEEVLQVRERKLGARHVAVANALLSLAGTLARQGLTHEAIAHCERAVQIYNQTVGSGDERTVNAMITLGATLMESGDFIRARKHYEQLVPLMERSVGPNDRGVAAALTNLANAQMMLEDHQGVEQQLQRALGILQRLYGPDHSDIQVVLNSLGGFYAERGRFREAVRTFEQSIANSRNSSARRTLAATAQEQLGDVLRSAGAYDVARGHFEAAMDILRQFPSESRVRYAISLADYGQLLLDAGNAAGAARPLEEAIAILRRAGPGSDYYMATVLVIHGELLARSGKASASERESREALGTLSKLFPPTHREVAAARSTLGEALLVQGKLVEAETELLAADELLTRQLNAIRRRSLQRLIRLYELKREPQAVQKYRQQLATFERRVRIV